MHSVRTRGRHPASLTRTQSSLQGHKGTLQQTAVGGDFLHRVQDDVEKVSKSPSVLISPDPGCTRTAHAVHARTGATVERCPKA